jgi:hypothetical protein
LGGAFDKYWRNNEFGRILLNILELNPVDNPAYNLISLAGFFPVIFGGSSLPHLEHSTLTDKYFDLGYW